MKYIAKIMMGAMAVMLLLPACTQEERVEANNNNSDKISFSVSLSGISSRSLSESNEYTLDWVDVFLFATGKDVHYQRLYPSDWEKSEADDGTIKYVTYLDADKRDYSTSFSVYAIANSSKGESEFEAVSSLDDLKAMTEETLFYEEVTQNHFLMDGKEENATADNDIEVTLKRAAAKIVLKLTANVPEIREDGYTYTYLINGTVRKKIVNYASVTSLLEDGKSLSVSDRELLGKEEDDYQPSGMVNEGSTVDVVFYSYANDWNVDPNDSQSGANNRTCLLVDVPVLERKFKTGEDAISIDYEHNYYKIPIDILGTNGNALKRNCMYVINATIKDVGQSTKDNPIVLSNLGYEVDGWEPIDINISGKDDVHFLAVNETSYEFRNADEDKTLKFVSSGPVTISIDSCYYYDKMGVYQEISSTNTASIYDESYRPTFEYDMTQNIDSIKINSTLLINTPKYIVLTISNAKGDSEKVRITQYPLDYIVSRQGYQSYKDGFTVRTDPTVRPTSNNVVLFDDFMFASYVGEYNKSDGSAKIYRWHKTNSGYREGNWITSPYLIESRTNAHVYEIRITQTSSQYTIGVPRIDDDGYTESSDENNKLVSPHFMLASQLGALTLKVSVTKDGVSKQQAREHCQKYVEEVYREGTDGYKDTYDDWRLPTLAELKIIAEYQAMENSAMDLVLGNTVNGYWSAGDSYVIPKTGSTNETKVYDSNANTTAYIRCVRDVHQSTQATN